MKEKSTQKKDIPAGPAPETEGVSVLKTEPAASRGDASDSASEADPLTVKIKTLEDQAAQDRDRLLRLSAEFDNYKKRMARQMDDFKKYANEGLLKDLLTIVDNLERAAATSMGEKAQDQSASGSESMAECVREGVEMTLNEIVKILTKHHVTVIDAMEKPFDPAYHEAVMQQASADHPENTVINVFQKGYRIHDRLLRPSMVVVSKKSA